MDNSNRKLSELQEMLLRLKCAATKPGNTIIWSVMRKRLLATRKVLNYEDVLEKKRKYDQILHGRDPLLKKPKRSKLLQLIDLISSVDPVENLEDISQIPCSMPNQGVLVNERDASGSFIPDGAVGDHSSSGSKKLVSFKTDPNVSDGEKRLGGGLQADKSYCWTILISDDSADCSASNHFLEVALRPEYPDEPIQSIKPDQSASVILITDDTADNSKKLTSKGTRKNKVSRDNSVKNGISTCNQFQKDITNSTGQENYDYNLDSSRGLGRQIWSKTANQKVPRRSKRISNFIDNGTKRDGSKRDVIPIGKRFQADIPNLINPESLHYSLDSSKWIGTKIWPTEGGNMDHDMKLIGKGRSDSSCYCDNPDSTECIKHHICEERTRMLSEIGDAFYSWGFDKMGETVADSWTLGDQNRFAKLFKKKTTLPQQSFWSRACKKIPFKCRESMVSYYFNVFVLRNVRRQVRSQSPVIDSDDDEADNGSCKPEASKMKWLR